MKIFTSILILLLVGCDSIYGLRVPVEPNYSGEWACATENLGELGLSGKIVNANQLSVLDKNNNTNIFTVIPRNRNTMELYFMQIHAPPSCEETTASFIKIQEFIKFMGKHCGYEAKSYKASMECSSNNTLNQTPKNGAG
jgi:hypothetical protein